MMIGCLTACGGSPPPHLTPDEVTGIPPGTATGTAFSGTFTIQSQSLDGCLCRRGNCSMVRALAGGQMNVSESNGALAIVIDSGSPYLGGIGPDGRFSAGQSLTSDILDAVSLLRGTVHPQSSVDAVLEETIVAALGAINYDCDIQEGISARYTGP